MAVIKYRPVLTEEQLLTVVQVLKSQLVITAEISSVLQVLALYLYKVQNKVVTPAYETVKSSIEQELGLFAAPASTEEQQLAAYVKWSGEGADTGAIACTVDELELALTYRINHDLLTEAEIEEIAMKQFDAAMAKDSS